MAELFNIVIGPSLERRRQAWLDQIGQAVEELRERLEGFDPHDLEGNEAFVTTVLTISTLAIRTHQDEKLEAFRHAIVNSVLPGAPGEFEQMTFLRFVEELTPTHVRMLTLLADPAGWFDRHGIPRPDVMASGLFPVVELAIPELTGMQTRSDQILTDLITRGLTVNFSIGGVMTGPALWVARISDFGRQFLDFIT